MFREEDVTVMDAKYHMTCEENIFVAKRNIVDYIWESAKLEGLAVTYPDTEAIYNGMSVQGVRVSDIIAVNNLKRAWQFVLETLDYPTDYPFVCKINQCVGGDSLIIRAGYLRNVPVSIGGKHGNRTCLLNRRLNRKWQRSIRLAIPRTGLLL